MGKKNRYDGMVIVIDIHYSNWKEYTWPNRFPSAYFYSFSLAPASEFKLMQDQTRQVVQDRDGEHKRILTDSMEYFCTLGNTEMWECARGGGFYCLSLADLFSNRSIAQSSRALFLLVQNSYIIYITCKKNL